jgi:outer membrane protein OmpA-like peptidoglycan-associated protein
MFDDRDKKKARIKWVKRISLMLAGLFLTYLVVGFWVVPPLLKPKLEEQLSSLLGREVTIAAITLNPLVLTATVSDLTIYELEGDPFAGFQELFVDAQLSSIINLALTAREIRMQAPFGVLRLFPENKLNIDDILAKLREPNPEQEQAAGLPPAVIERFEVIDGSVTVEDLTGKEPIQEVVAPIAFTLENLSTLKGRPGEYRFLGTGPAGGRYEVTGQLTVNPVRVQGRYATTGTPISHYWKHLKDRLSFQIIRGTMRATGHYILEIVDGQINAKLENGAFDLSDFELVQKGKEEVLIALPTFAVKGIHADLQAREITVGTIQTADAQIKTWLGAEGTLAPLNLFLPDLERFMEKKASHGGEPETAPGEAWRVMLKKMELTNWGLAFEDRTLTKPAEISVDDIHVVVEDLSNKKDTQATVGMAMQINRAGHVKIHGTAGIDPLKADLQVASEKIALKPFQPYVDDAVNARIEAGTTRSKGRIQYLGQDARPTIRYKGDFSVDGLKIQDRVQTEDFITMAQFKADGIVLELLPNKLLTSHVLIDRPRARVTIDRNGVVNVVNAFRPVETKEEEEKNLLQRVVSFLILQFKGPIEMNIDRVQLENLAADFVDGSISPTYSTHVEITEGSVKGLSSDPAVLADFKIEGRIDPAATFGGTGRMNPMSARQYSKADVSLKDFDLKPVSPYSGKFVGYNIDKGTLHLDLKYQVEDDQVNGNNVIYIDQLKLGEKVDSPHAPNLPIKLGVALLKDKKGRITVQVPVEGDVKDPRFNFGKAVQSALTGTIDDAGSDPFSTIPEIDGFKGKDLRTVAFDFGLSELQKQETQKLNALAAFLKERDPLILGIVGTADRQMDGAAILAESPAESLPGDDQASDKDTKEEPALAQAVNDERLERLAQRRAEKVSRYLIEQARVEAKRIQLKPVEIKQTPDGETGLVELFLSVE